MAQRVYFWKHFKKKLYECLPKRYPPWVLEKPTPRGGSGLRRAPVQGTKNETSTPQDPQQVPKPKYEATGLQIIPSGRVGTAQSCGVSRYRVKLPPNPHLKRHHCLIVSSKVKKKRDIPTIRPIVTPSSSGRRMPWRWVTGGRRSDKTMGNAVPGLWGGGNAASLMEARSMAESAIRDERAHARRGFAEMESAGERSDAEDGNVEIVGSKAQGHKISATEQLLAARAPGSIPEATDAKALGTIQESTAHTSPEQVAMLRRLGLNRVEVCGLSDRCGAVAWSATTA
jgi:hypothetical protein